MRVYVLDCNGALLGIGIMSSDYLRYLPDGTVAIRCETPDRFMPITVEIDGSPLTYDVMTRRTIPRSERYRRDYSNERGVQPLPVRPATLPLFKHENHVHVACRNDSPHWGPS